MQNSETLNNWLEQVKLSLDSEAEKRRKARNKRKAVKRARKK